MTLVILGMFVVMAVGTMALINRQFKEIVGQEQEEQAFQIAEAGVHYALWLLDNGLIDYADPQEIEDYEVTDDTQDPPVVIGSFDLEFETESYTAGTGPAAVKVTATGKDAVINRPQKIEATIYSGDLDDFVVVEWDHRP